MAIGFARFISGSSLTLYQAGQRLRSTQTKSAKIRAVEKYPIDLGLTVNPDVLNKKDTKPPGWGIQGVIRGGKGKVSAGTSSFRQMLGIEK